MGLSHSPNIPTDGLILLYDVTNPKTFDNELSNTTTINDRSGNGNIGTLNLSRRDYYDRSLNLKKINPTINGYISVPNFYINPTNITMSCWVNVESFNSSSDPSYIFSKKSGSTGYAVTIHETEGNEYINVHVNNSIVNAGSISSIMAANTWIHVAVTISDSLVRVYLNGTLVGSVVNITGAISSNFESITIGKYNLSNTGYFNAAINNIAMYERSLSDSEISQLYSAQVSKDRRIPNYSSDSYGWIPRQIDFPVGTTSWVVPPGVTSISAVCVGGGGGGAGSQATGAGGGGGGGGGFAYGNIPVSAGQTLYVVVGSGGNGGPGGLLTSSQSNGIAGQGSYIQRSSQQLLAAGGGGRGINFGSGGEGGTTSGIYRQNGGTGGNGGQANTWGRAGGGGAGGYTGNGGNGDGGGVDCSQPARTAQSGSGGGAGGGGRASNNSAGGGGGGVGIQKSGTSGGQGACKTGGGGGGGGSGGSPASAKDGALYGGGGGGGSTYVNTSGGNGARGAVRFVIGGKGRYYPSTNSEFEV